MASKKLNKFDNALESFYKLQQIMRNDAQVMFQVINWNLSIKMSWKNKMFETYLNECADVVILKV